MKGKESSLSSITLFTFLIVNLKPSSSPFIQEVQSKFTFLIVNLKLNERIFSFKLSREFTFLIVNLKRAG